MTLAALYQKVTYLQFINRKDWIDGGPAGGPHGNLRISSSLYELLVASVIREVASGLAAKTAAALHNATRSSLQRSAAGLIQGWEDGDDICPPWPWPWPKGWSPVGTVPDTVPSMPDSLAESALAGVSLESMPRSFQAVVRAGLLRELAALTGDAELSGRLRDSAVESLVPFVGKGRSVLIDECGTPVPHRVPRIGPRPPRA